MSTSRHVGDHIQAAVNYRQEASVVATDGTVTHRPYPKSKKRLGGVAILDVSSRGKDLEWKRTWVPRASRADP